MRRLSFEALALAEGVANAEAGRAPEWRDALPRNASALPRPALSPVLSTVALAMLAALASTPAQAQRAPALVAQTDADSVKSAPMPRKPVASRASPLATAATKPKPASQAEASPAGANASTAGADPELFTKQLRAAQATTCLPAVEGLARASVIGPSEFQVVSNWSKGAPNTRMVNVLIGSKNTAPNGGGMAAIVASPVGPNTCDGYVMQIVSNASPCAELQKTTMPDMAPTQVAGTTIVAMKDGGQTVLIPAGAACTMVRVRMFNQP